MKKVGAILVSFLSVVLLIACSQQGTSKKSTTSSSQTTTSSEVKKTDASSSEVKEKEKKEEKKDDLRQVYVERAKDYIASSYSDPITVEDVADYTGISRSYLFRAFQAYQKQSPKEYLTEYRIRQACHLLRETGLSVASIAYSVGFEDNLYFSKAFKKKMQMSPSQSRKNQMT